MPHRPSRRLVLGGGALAVAGAGLARAGFGPPDADGPEPIEVRARPVAALLPPEPDRRRFGALTFRSGLVLSSPSRGFGGLSGLWRAPDGTEIVAVSDHGRWFSARLASRDGRLVAVGEATLAPILDGEGRPLGATPAYDTESLAFDGESAFVGIERVHAVLAFDRGRDGVAARGRPLDLPGEIGRLPSNAGLEALAVAPPGHPLAGALLAIAEDAAGGEASPTRGWVLTGSRRFGFEVARSDHFAVTDMTFLPEGDLLLLERRFFPLSGVACRIRRIAPDAFRPDARLDGPVLFEADGRHVIDNMEGIAAHRDPLTGERVVTLVSDDNFSRLQRTLLLEFVLER